MLLRSAVEFKVRQVRAFQATHLDRIKRFDTEAITPVPQRAREYGGLHAPRCVFPAVRAPFHGKRLPELPCLPRFSDTLLYEPFEGEAVPPCPLDFSALRPRNGIVEGSHGEMGEAVESHHPSIEQKWNMRTGPDPQGPTPQPRAPRSPPHLAFVFIAEDCASASFVVRPGLADGSVISIQVSRAGCCAFLCTPRQSWHSGVPGRNFALVWIEEGGRGVNSPTSHT